MSVRLVIIGSGYGLMMYRRQAITETNADDIANCTIRNILKFFIVQQCSFYKTHSHISWWRHQMETFSALLAICAGNSPVSGEFPAQKPMTRSCDIFFDLRLNKWLSKQSWGWWFETLSCPLSRHCNDRRTTYVQKYDVLLPIRTRIKAFS